MLHGTMTFDRLKQNAIYYLYIRIKTFFFVAETARFFFGDPSVNPYS